MSTVHDFNALVAAKAQKLQAWKVAKTSKDTALAVKRASEDAAGLRPRPSVPGKRLTTTPQTPRATPGPTIPRTPSGAIDWDAVMGAVETSTLAEAAARKDWTAAKNAQDAAEKDVGAQ